LTEPIQYTVKENGIVIKSGTLSIDNTTFAVTAKWETLLVTFTSSHDSKQVEMAYTIKPSTAGMTPVARIGTTAGQNEYYFLEDALTASNSGVSGNIVLLTDYTMYSGSNPRVAWSNNDNGYTLKSGIRFQVGIVPVKVLFILSPALPFGSVSASVIGPEEAMRLLRAYFRSTSIIFRM